MPSDDLVLNVRQILNYPDTTPALGSDALLIQRGGLGGPYYSIEAENFVATALSEGGTFSVQSGIPPADAFGGQIFCHGLSLFSEGYLASGIYWTGSGWKHYGAILPGGAFGFNPNVGYVLDFAPPGVSGADAPLSRAMTITPAGAMTLNMDTLTVARDPVSPLEVATARFVAASTVGSFNGRTGAVTLNLGDILGAGGAPIFSPRFGGQPRALTPPLGDNSSWLATTAFVQATVGQQLDLSGYALLDSPAFIGVPTAPTASPGSSDGQLATTAFVQNAVADSVTGVASFNARTGNVVLTSTDITAAGGAPIASPTFTGLPSAPTASPGNNTTQLATTQFVTAAVAAATAGVASFNGRTGAVVLTSADIAPVGVSSFNGRLGAVNLIGNDVSAAGGALNASPAFTGTPTAPTAIPATNTTQIATTAFVQAAVSAATAGVTTWNGRAGAVTFTAADLTGVGGALLASPTFSGVPAAPTAAPGANTTQLATTAFVTAAVAASTAGVSSFNSRTGVVTLIANDLSAAGGALLASPIFTGTPTGPTASPGTNNQQLATTAFVSAAITAQGGPFLPLTGGTISGSLQVNGAGVFPGGIAPSTTLGITGTQAGDNANAGSVGEIQQIINIGYTPGTGLVYNQCILPLTAGDWDVSAEFWMTVTGGSITSFQANISPTSGAAISAPQMNGSRVQLGGTGLTLTGPNIFGLATCRFNLSAAASVYLVGLVNFTGTISVSGKLWARRRR
jgi:hypothetical protein